MTRHPGVDVLLGHGREASAVELDLIAGVKSDELAEAIVVMAEERCKAMGRTLTPEAIERTAMSFHEVAEALRRRASERRNAAS